MDLISGIAAATQAVQLVKELKAIDRSVDEATFKNMLADLTLALADTKIALSEARVALADREAENADLKRQLSAARSGETCPVCLVGTLRVTAVRDHLNLGDVGVQERDLECSNEACRHRERRAHDPMGVMKK
jgi:DNA repair exonuclease SbcCD ATPase subunit